MSDSDSQPLPDRRALVLRYLDDTLAPAAVARLNEQLRIDAALRREFAELLLQHILLGDLGREALVAGGHAAVAIPASTLEPLEAVGALAFPGPGESPGKWTLPWNRWSLPLALAASIALLLSVAIWLFPPTQNEPTLTFVPSATVTIERGIEMLAAHDRMSLRAGDVLNVVGTNMAKISYGSERTEIIVAGATELTILPWSAGKRFGLRAGKIEATVARQRPWHPMTWTTAQAEARVLGTHFTLSATTNATQLDVTEGKVRFTRASDGTSVIVAADWYSRATANSELTALPRTGGLLRECWNGVKNQTPVAWRTKPPFLRPPDGRDKIPNCALTLDQTNDLALRLTGYLHPPVTGDYEFWLEGTLLDPAKVGLFMSPSEDPTEAVLIAQSGNRTAIKAPPPIPLVGGRRYYICVRFLLASGAGQVLVEWKPPGGSRQPITGEFLSPSEPGK